VTITLLVAAVDILLDEHPLESCPVLDLDRDGALRLHEVVRLVAIALGEVS